MVEMREIRLQTLADGSGRTETWEGRDYYVVPIVALQEGVLQGANAANPEYVPVKAFTKNPYQWNGRPLVMNHPKVRGVFVSANQPQVLADWSFGFIFNTRIEDDKLKMEGWIDIDKANSLGGDFKDTLDRCQANEIVEVSTGLYTDIIPVNGTWNGKNYTGEWDNVISDHLALLSKGVQGACSVADGCGTRVNTSGDPEMRLNEAALRTFDSTGGTEGADAGTGDCGCDQTDGEPQCDACKQKQKNMSVPNVQQLEAVEGFLPRIQLEGSVRTQSLDGSVLLNDAYSIVNKAVKEKFKDTCEYCYVIDLSADFVILQVFDNDWKMCTQQVRYDMDAQGNVTFNGDPVEVILMTRVLPKPKVNASGVEGAETTATMTGSTPATPNSISNNARGDAMDPVQSADPSAPAVVASAASPTAAGSQVTAPAATPTVNATPRFNTMEELLAAVPPEMAQVLSEGVRLQSARRQELYTAIKANAANTFADAQLEGFDMKTLESIAALAKVAPAPAPSVNEGNRFDGISFAGRVNAAANAQDSSVAGQPAPVVNSENNGFGAPPIQSFAVQSSHTVDSVGTWKH